MFAPTPDATQHYRARAAERAIPPDVELFLQMWGTEIWAAGARQITLFRKNLPPDLRDSPIALSAEGWILVAAPNGALMTCYHRCDAWRFVARKSDVRRRRKPRRRHRHRG
jgi:hypothetical protein